MKQKIFFSILIFVLVFFPLLETRSSSGLPEEEREVLLEQYKALKERLNYLRWYVQKFDLQKKIRADSYLVVNLSDNSTLLWKDNEKAYSIASITKLMTAVVAVENIKTEEKLVLDQSMFLVNSYQRQSPAIYPGAQVGFKDLLKASLIQSTNNAAQSLTQFLTEKDFIILMNKTAQEIGMEESFFLDVHGLSSFNRSSASDLAKLINYIRNNHPQILEITLEENFQLPGKCPEFEWLCTFKNLNLFHGLEEFVGGKAGYTEAAGNTFAGLFELNDTRYTIILLNTPSRTKDTQKIWEWINKKP